MGHWLALPAVALAGAIALACGGASTTAHRSVDAGAAEKAALSGSPRGDRYLRGDYDDDDNGGSDSDDGYVRAYGHEGAPTDRRAVASLVKRYYIAAAAGDGATACLLLDSRFAKSRDLVELIPHDYMPAAGSSVVHGRNCAQIASRLFEPNHAELAMEAATVQLAGLRVDGGQGLALLLFRGFPEGQIPVRREGGVWRIDGLLGSTLP